MLSIKVVHILGNLGHLIDIFRTKIEEKVKRINEKNSSFGDKITI